jgi:hypothetical protein
MTAEVAVMNRQGIALAADSAVTINYPGGQKIYNSVNKLFTLSKYAPVGVMIYGVADLTGVPWETIIKSVRRELGETRYDTVREYADELISYIRRHKLMFSEHLQMQQFGSSVLLQFRNVLGMIDDAVQAEIANRGVVDDRILQRVATKTIRGFHIYWMDAGRLPGVPSRYAERLRAKYESQADALIDYMFGKLPLSGVSRRRLHELAANVFSKELFPDNVSGVVVAGYGEAEFFPSLHAFDVEGVLLSFVKIRENLAKTAAVQGVDSAAIVPFAQGEMVSLFMEGVDPSLRRDMRDALKGLMADLVDETLGASTIPPAAERALRKRMVAAGDDFCAEFNRRLAVASDERHVQPVVSSVAYLPKEELASMAESLVSLTSFKRRVTQDPETVGGPVDVAVISKGDGFIWINRKHYFDPSLNHQFFSNYYRP